MNDKYMMGDFICSLRKEKGLSQHELGHMVGVSNKAVSKWETGEANPETAILLKIAEVLGVTTDELLRGERAANNNSNPKSERSDSCDSNNLNEPIISIKVRSLEYKSKRVTKKGVPFVHINFSSPSAKAHGVIAIGFRAKGVISIGLLCYGLISCGLLSFGLLSFGSICFGLIAGGGLAAGGVAAGGVALGVVAIGGVAIGFLSIGGVSIGYYAYTGTGGVAIGVKEYIWDYTRSAPEPIETERFVMFAKQRLAFLATRVFLPRI